MENQDHRKNHSSGQGSHGVHVCNKCGWPFPNAHPSARHRRSHRKICGTVEGYKLVGSEETSHVTGSDHENHSGEELKTPSQVVDSTETQNNISGSGGMSNRSEDDAIADAVAEFSSDELSPVAETLMVKSEPINSMDKVYGVNPEAGNSLNSKDNIQPSRKSTESNRIENPEVIGSLAVESSLESQDIISDSTQEIAPVQSSDKTISVCDAKPINSDTTTDSLLESKKIDAGDAMTDGGIAAVLGSSAVESSPERQDIISDSTQEVAATQIFDKNISTCDMKPIKSDTPTDSPQESKQTDVGDAMTDSMAEADLEGNKEIKIDRNLPSVAYEAYLKSETTQDIGSITENSKGIIQPEMEHSDGLPSGRSIADLPSGDRSYDHGSILVDTAEIEADGQGIESVRDVPVDHAEGGDHKVKVISATPSEIASVEYVSLDTAEIKADAVQDICSANSITPTRDDNREDEITMTVLSPPVSDDTLVVDNDKVIPEGLINHMEVETAIDHSADIESVANDNLLSDTAEMKTAAVQGIETDDSIVSIEDKNPVEEGDGSFLRLSVPDDIPVVEHAELLLEGYKDHKGVKLHQYLPLDFHEPTKDTEADTEAPVHVNNFTTSDHDDPSKVTEVSTPDIHEGGDDKFTNEEVPAIGEANVPDTKLVINQGSVESEGPSTDAGIIETEKGQEIFMPVESRARDHCENFSPISLSESAKEVQSETIDDVAHMAGHDYKMGSGAENKVASFESTNQFSESETSLLSTPGSATTSPTFKVVKDDALDIVHRELPEVEITDLDRVSKIPDKEEHEIDDNYKSERGSTSLVSMATEVSRSTNAKLMQEDSDVHASEESKLSPSGVESRGVIPAATETNNGRELAGDASMIHPHNTIQVEDEKHPQITSAVDVSADSISRNDSLDGNWGSVSVLSMQSDTPSTVIDAEAEKGNSKKPKDSNVVQTEKSDKAISFVTNTIQRPEKTETASLQTDRSPSVSHVANESQGQNNNNINKEVIAKVANWGNEKQRVQLKNFLNDSRLSAQIPKENPTHLTKKSETNDKAKEDGSLALKVSSILGPEASTVESANGEVDKEWNSPARYPTDMKGEKRKIQGRPFWAQFVCCSSVN